MAQSWTNGRNSFYRLDGIEKTEQVESDGASIDAEPRSKKRSIKGPTLPQSRAGDDLRALLKSHGARESIEHDLKNEIMRWFLRSVTIRGQSNLTSWLKGPFDQGSSVCAMT